MRKTLVSVLLAGTLAAGGAVAFTSMSAGATTAASTARACPPRPPRPSTPTSASAVRRAVVRISAKTIGVTPADLLQELKSGKSIADVAGEHNVQASTVVNAAGEGRRPGAHQAGAQPPDHRGPGQEIVARLPALATKVVNKHFK